MSSKQIVMYFCNTRHGVSGIPSWMIKYLAIYCRNDKGDTLTGSYFHTVSPLTNTSVGAEFSHCFSSNENTLTIGTQHALDPLTNFKAKVNNYGKASAAIQHIWQQKAIVTISGEVDALAIEKSAKVGLCLILMPWNQTRGVTLMFVWCREISS